MYSYFNFVVSKSIVRPRGALFVVFPNQKFSTNWRMTGQAVAKYCYFFFLSLSLLSCCVAKIQNDANGFEIEYRLIKTNCKNIVAHFRTWTLEPCLEVETYLAQVLSCWNLSDQLLKATHVQVIYSMTAAALLLLVVSPSLLLLSILFSDIQHGGGAAAVLLPAWWLVLLWSVRSDCCAHLCSTQSDCARRYSTRIFDVGGVGHTFQVHVSCFNKYHIFTFFNNIYYIYTVYIQHVVHGTFNLTERII